MSTKLRSPLGPGEAAPWFRAPVLNGSDAYAFDTAGGRPVLMLLFGTAANPACAEALAKMEARRALFDDRSACFFGVSVDRSDVDAKRLRPQLPGIRFFLDHDRAVSRAFGALADEAGNYRGHWLLLDHSLRVVARYPIAQSDAALDAFEALVASPPAQDFAPVLVVPDLLEPDMCRGLIDLYLADGGEDSGFMRDVGGVTKLLLDPKHKVRRDCSIEEPELARQLNLRIMHRLVPMIARAFSFQATRVERLIVGCYDAASGGHFRPHRDNTALGTAHRRFAVTVNLNAEEYEGGDLRFPEFGPRTYRAPTGGAIVFSCALLHEATPVTKGTRYAFLPFLYDEAGAQLREKNSRFLEGELANYKATQDVRVG
jgi:peroxiredoxin/predicted 2-oxoglutarate/Fe(II)-dependent dioxygenase YbiX